MLGQASSDHRRRARANIFEEQLVVVSSALHFSDVVSHFLFIRARIGETNEFPARSPRGSVQESGPHRLHMPMSSRNAPEPSDAALRESEGLWVGEHHLEMGAPTAKDLLL